MVKVEENGTAVETKGNYSLILVSYDPETQRTVLFFMISVRKDWGYSPNPRWWVFVWKKENLLSISPHEYAWKKQRFWNRPLTDWNL